jgi:hypothetical protein
LANAIVASIESGERQSWKRSDGCPVGAEQVCRDVDVVLEGRCQRGGI